MIKRTFGQVKNELARVAGQSGLNANDPRLREQVFLAQERLSDLGEWPYQYARVKFSQRGGVVSLPTEYEALVHVAVGDEPVEIQPRWFEFLEFGPGPFKKENWSCAGLDLGEHPVSLQPDAQGAKLRVTSTNGGDTGAVTVFGYDKDGLYKQVDFALPDATSTVTWGKIERVVKPVTSGDVVLSYTDWTGQTFVAAAYRPRDTSPSFRTYRFPQIGDRQTAVIQGVVRRRLMPILGDSDELFITNLGALRLGVKAIGLEDKGDIVGSANCIQLAVQILKEEANRYKASRNTAPVNVSRVASLSVRPDIH